MIDWNLFLIISIFAIIGEFSADLLVMILVFFCKKSQLEIDLEKEVHEIKTKMDGISMVDEFAKYAKLQRKLNRLVEDLKTESKETKEMFRSMKYITSFAVDLFWNGICFYIIWSNLSTPLLHLNPSWLTPFNGLIGWPSTTPGDMGILLWYMVVKNVAKKVTFIRYWIVVLGFKYLMGNCVIVIFYRASTIFRSYFRIIVFSYFEKFIPGTRILSTVN